MKRRDFVSMLIGASTASIIVPKQVFSLPPRGFSTFDMTLKNYFTSPHVWFLKTEKQDGLRFYARQRLHDEDLAGHVLSNSSAAAVDLSEQSIKNLVAEIRKLTDDRGKALTIRATRRICSPIEYRLLMSEGQ